MEFTDEQLQVNNEFLEGDRGMVRVNGVIVESITADNSGNIFFVAAANYAGREGYADYVAYAAWHYDKRVDLLNMIIGDVSYSDCLAATVKYREGERY
jgi:hypothetical protein